MTSKYICIDTETSGLDSIKNNLLTACFIILDKHLNEIDRLNISIKHDEYSISVKALEINKIDLIKHHNNLNTVDIINGNKNLINFLKKNKGRYRLTPIFHNAIFDIGFIQSSGLLIKEEYDIYFSYNAIDTITIAQFLKICNKLPENQSLSLTSLTEYNGLINNSSNFHTAEYDTEMTISLLKKFIQVVTVADIEME